MPPERWERIEELFHSTVELTAHERSAYLDRHCPDAEMRAEVESLLASEVAAIPAFHEAVGRLASQVAEQPDAPAQVGPYRIEREIGRGGMGAVYLATRADDEFHRQVAVKLVKRGLDTDFILQRFRTERQILANLDHPGIAKLHDGGTTGDNRPYIVMEFIDGVPITTWCRQQGLERARRLELFLKVCEAVSNAHANLIVHRDLKPSNILVTKEGEPKLLDFGIAKILDPSQSEQTVMETGVQMRLLTPEYASPEQVRGEAVTTATDVYALGAILYEMLTGEQAQRFNTRSPQELIQVVCEDEPRLKPAGDELDAIIRMALRKEARRRYASVNQFAEDVQRFLSERPVIARPDTIGYRASKFVRRNRLGVVAAMLVVLSLLGGILATSYQWRRAEENALRAEHRFSQVRKLANTFLFDVESRLRTLSGTTETREFLVKTALEYLDSLAKEAEGDQGLQQELAAAYEKVGDIQAAPGESNLGQNLPAIKSYETAIAILESLATARPSEAKIHVSLSSTRRKLAVTLGRTPRSMERVPLYRKGIDSAKEAVALAPNDPAAVRELQLAYAALSNSSEISGQLTDALRYAEEAIPAIEKLQRMQPGRESQAALANMHFRTASLLRKLGQTERALEHIDQSLNMRQELLRLGPNDVRNHQSLMSVYLRKGDILGLVGSYNLGRTKEAVASYREAIAIGERLLTEDPKNSYVRTTLGYVKHSLACTLVETQPMETLQLLDEVLAASEEKLLDKANLAVRLDLSSVFLDRASALTKLGRIPEAIRNVERGIALQREVAVAYKNNPHMVQNMMGGLQQLAEIHASQKQMEAAKRHYSELAAIASTVRPSVQDLERVQSTAEAFESYAGFLHASGDVPASCAHYQKSLEYWTEVERRGVASKIVAPHVLLATQRSTVCALPVESSKR